MKKRYKRKRSTKPMSESILENYIKTEGFLDWFKKDPDVKKLRKGKGDCTPRGAFEPHQIYNGQCLSITDIKKLKAQANESIQEQDIDVRDEVESDDSLGAFVATQVNDTLNRLPEGNPFKNRQAGLDMMKEIIQALRNPDKVGQIIEDEIERMREEMV